MTISTQEYLNASILLAHGEVPEVRQLVVLLRDAGYRQVLSMPLPKDLSALCIDNQYDLILLDLDLPTRTGLQVMTALAARGEAGSLPVIALTSRPACRIRALRAGAQDFISRPYDAVDVRTRVKNALEVAMLYKQLGERNATLERAVAARTAQLQASEARFRSLTELASDWYWEQNEAGEFTTVSGPVFEMLGVHNLAPLVATTRADAAIAAGWNEVERKILRQKIAARQPFLDFAVSKVSADGSAHQFRVSGEPIFSKSNRFIGYRGVGVECSTKK